MELKKFIRIMVQDVKDEKFTDTEKIIFGVVVPAALVLVMAIAGTLVS